MKENKVDKRSVSEDTKVDKVEQDYFQTSKMKLKCSGAFLYWLDMWFKWNPYMLPFRHLWIEDEQ